MLIGELSRRSGLSRDTIRFYEKEGLLQSSHTNQNSYKEFSESTVAKLAQIKNLQGLGFTLREVANFIRQWKEEDASCSNLQYALEDKVADIDRQIANLAQTKGRLANALAQCKSNNCKFETFAGSL